MPNPVQLGFNAGIFGPLMYGRSDLQRYRLACRTMKNFTPTVQGPALKRSGTRFVKRTRTAGTAKTRLIPFEFSRDQAYIIDLSENNIRFLRDSGAVLETAVAISVGTPPTIAANCEITTNVNHGYSTNDEIFISGSRLEMLNEQFFRITVTALDKFTIATTTTGESLVAAGVNTVARVYKITDGVSSNSIPWDEDDMDAIQYAQDADVMYLVHPDYPPHKLARTADTSWTCTEVDFSWPAFRDENVTDTTVYVDAASGTTVTVQASADIFTADMVGSYIKIGEIPESANPVWTANNDMATEFSAGGVDVGDHVHYDGNVYELVDKNGSAKTGTIAPIHAEYGQIEADRARGENGYEWEFVHRGWGYAKIETFTDANTIVVDVDNYGVQFPGSVVGSTRATKKWAIGAFNEEYGYPSAVALFESRLWLAGTAQDPQTFWGSRTNRFEDFEVISEEADSGLSFTILSNRVNAIQWMTGEDLLIIGTRGGEFTAQGAGQDESITADNIVVKKRSAFGSAPDVAPIFVDSSLIMAQRDKRRLHELTFDLDTNLYGGVDLTAMAHSILGNGAVGISYQAAPFRQIFVHTSAGALLALTYVKEESVAGWSEYVIAAPASTPDGIVESVATIPHPDGDRDQVWLVVRRTISGGPQRWIEYLEEPFADDGALEDGFFVDAGVTFSGTATTTIYGLLHLAGLDVSYLRNGVAATGTVSSKGILTVTSATKAHIGFPVSAELETMDFDLAQPPLSTTTGDKGRVVAAVFRLHNTGAGLQYGPSSDAATFDTFVSTSSLFSGMTPKLTIPGGNDREQRVALIHETPAPCTIEAIIPTIALGNE